MKTQKDPRHLARIFAMQRLYSLHFNKQSEGIQDLSIEKLIELNENDHYDKKLEEEIFQGVQKDIEIIDKYIMDFAPQWTIEQMKKVDIEIMRIAIFEGFTAKLTPPKVAIDEAIEIAKEFGGEVSGKFVNGVLGALYEKSKL